MTRTDRQNPKRTVEPRDALPDAMVRHWLVTGHAGECLFLTRYYYCSFCGEHTLSAHRATWTPTAEKWREVFPNADTVHLAETFFHTILTAAFPTCRGRAPNDVAPGIFAFWANEVLQGVARCTKNKRFAYR